MRADARRGTSRPLRIRAVELRRLRIPLKRAFAHALSSRAVSESVFVALEADDGRVGWGEILPRPYVTGESLEGVFEVSAPALAHALFDATFDHPDDLSRWLDDRAGLAERELAVLAGFDVALFDLAVGWCGRSIPDLLGLVEGPWLPAGVIIGFEHPTASLARYCATLRLAGKTHVKVKVGQDDDVERLAAVAKVYKSTPLRLDANAAWTVDETIERLGRLAEVAPIASIEQPIAPGDLLGAARIRRATGVALMADESVCSLDEGRALIEAGAADIFNVRLGKNGGFRASARLVALARDAGLGVHLGTMVGESGVLSSAAELFGRSVPQFACLDGKGQNRFLLQSDVLAEGDAPSGGLGIAVDPDRICAHQVGPTLRVAPNPPAFVGGHPGRTRRVSRGEPSEGGSTHPLTTDGDRMSIEKDLLEYISTELAPGTSGLEAESTLAGVIDSTAVMELVVWLEGEYGFDVEIDDITPENFGSVKALAAYVEERKE